MKRVKEDIVRGVLDRLSDGEELPSSVLAEFMNKLRNKGVATPAWDAFCSNETQSPLQWHMEFDEK